jgi:catechol 2,3-dioxygenase-like lactoylglutathione lyase family enzyme
VTGLFRKIDCHSIPVSNLDEALAFYRDGLGHELIWRDAMAAGLRLPESDAELVLHTDARPIETDLWVVSVPAAIDTFVAAGGKVVLGPFEIRIGLCAVLGGCMNVRLSSTVGCPMEFVDVSKRKPGVERFECCWRRA